MSDHLIDNYEVIEEHELPDTCEADFVTINRWDDGDLFATPFIHRTEGPLAPPEDSGRKWYDEPDEDEWSPSEEYREAIEELSDYPIEEIRTEREFAEPQGYWDHNREEFVEP